MCTKIHRFVVLVVICLPFSFSLAATTDTFETVSSGTTIAELPGWSAENDGPLARVQEIANATDVSSPVAPLDWGQNYLDLSRNGASGTEHAVYLRQMANHIGDTLSISFDVRFRTLGAVHFMVMDSGNYASTTSAGIHFYTDPQETDYTIRLFDGGGGSGDGTILINTTDWYRIQISADMTDASSENWTWLLSVATMNSDGTWGDFESLGRVSANTPYYGPFAFKNTDLNQVDLLKILSYPNVVDGGGMVLDNLSITPEPTSALLLALAMPWLRRRRT